MQTALCLAVVCVAVAAVCADDTVPASIGIVDGGVGRCTPGTTYKKDCNTCRCGPDGVEACTLIGCLGNFGGGLAGGLGGGYGAVGGDDIREGGGRCTPGTTFKKDCNTCFCGHDGVVGCTLIGCLGRK